MSIRILVLEDNPTDALLVEQELRAAFGPSVQIAVAAQLYEAIAFAHAREFDVCLLDLNVPDSSGLATFERMRVEARALPLIVFTGAHDEQMAARILRSGAQDYVVKQAGMGPLLTRTLRFAIERNKVQVDLTQRDAQLLRSENQIRRIIEANADGVIVVDGGGLVQFVNPAAEAMFGRTAVELIGGDFGFPLLIGQAAEIDLLRSDHSTLIAEMRVVDVVWEEKPALLASLRDVTERKREKAALEIRAQLATLSAEVGFALTAASTSLSQGLQLTTEVLVRYMDIAFARIWTLDGSPEKLLLEAHSGTWIDSDSSAGREPLGGSTAGRIARSGEPYTTNDVGKDPNIKDSPGWIEREGLVSFAGYPIEVEGKIVGVLVAFGRSRFADPVLQSLASESKKIGQFITRKRADEEIQQLNKDLERQVAERTAELRVANAELESFSYSVAHDLRAPIRHVAGFSRILAEECGDGLGEQPRRYLQSVQDGAKRMGELVDDLLNLARTSRQTLSRRPTDLNDLIDVVRNELKNECSGREIEWHIDPLWTARCDPSLVRQVFVNLLSNALKFTRLRPRAIIHIGWQWGKSEGVDVTPPGTADNGDRVIVVRDNGAGFDMACASKLFAVFQRLHSGEDFEGTGVGLANVQRIVHKHGGRIWAESALDQGATFFFTIPDGFESGFPHPTPAEEMICVSD